MADAKKAWSDVGDRLSALGLKLKFHAEEELSDAADETASGIERLKKSVSEAWMPWAMRRAIRRCARTPRASLPRLPTRSTPRSTEARTKLKAKTSDGDCVNLT